MLDAGLNQAELASVVTPPTADRDRVGARHRLTASLVVLNEAKAAPRLEHEGIRKAAHRA
jgi:hypothetical protein